MTSTTVGVCRFFLNDELVTVDGADPLAPLVNTIRERCHAKATKVGCNQGNCGACTVTIAWPEGDPRYTKAPMCVNACLFPTGGLFVDPQADPAAVCPKVMTVEGAMKNDRMQTAAKTIAECNGTQCGFCTAGMVMKAAYYEGEVQAGLTNCTVRDVEDLLEGNLCRCTGFRPILYALKKHFVPTTDPNYDKVAAEIADTPDLVKQGLDDAYLKCYATGDYANKNVFVPEIPDETAEPLVGKRHRPEETKGNAFLLQHKGQKVTNRNARLVEQESKRLVSLKSVAKAERDHGGDDIEDAVEHHQHHHLHHEHRVHHHHHHHHHHEGASAVATPVPVVAPTGRGGFWVAPYTVADVIGSMQKSLKEGRQFQLVAGNCASAWSRLYEEPPNHDYISVAHVAELQQPIQLNGTSVRVSSGTTLNDWLAFLYDLQKTHPNDQTLDLVIQHSFATANIQVRHLGTIAGNIIYANTRKGILHSDISLMFAALGATMVYTTDGVTERRITVAEFQQTVTPIQGVWVCKYFTLMVPLQDKITVHVARTGDRNENFPTSCSAAYSCYAGAADGAMFFTGPHHLPDGSTMNPAPVLIAMKSNLPNNNPYRALEMLKVEILTNPVTAPLALYEKQLMAQMSARVLTVDNGASGVQMTSMLEERKIECQTKNAQYFYVDPIESPLTEPLVKNDAYLAATGKAVYPFDAVEADMVNVAPVLSPATIMLFDPFDFQTKGKAYVQSIEPAADFFTAASMPYDPAVDTDINKHVPLPWVKAPTPADDARMWTGRNVLFGDFGFGGNYQYSVKETLKPNYGKDANNVYGPGGFGEFVVAPGYTTYAGQVVAYVVHPDETKARGLAALITSELQANLNSQPTKLPLFVQDVTSDLGILDIEASRKMGKAILGPEVQSPSIFARGLGTYNDDASEKEYEKWWDDAKADPANVYTDLMPGDFVDDATGWSAAFAESKKKAEQHSAATGTPVQQYGPVSAAAQAHMYLETQVCLVSPINEGRYRVTTATQGVTDISGQLTRMLNVPVRDIVSVNNRIGGSYGGKTVFAMYVATCCAFIAKVTGKATRLCLERRADLQIVGKRHREEGRYRVVLRGDPTKPDFGTILGLDLWYDGDAGCGTFVSCPILQFSGLMGDGMYNVPNFRLTGNAYLTHKQSSTAMRSFGGIQGVTITETAIDQAYAALRLRNPASTLTAEQFRAINFYRKVGNVIPTTPWRSWVSWETPNPPTAPPQNFFVDYHQELVETDIMTGNETYPGVWNTTINSTDFLKAVQECKDFNATNVFRKRGIATIPMKYVGGWDPKDNMYGFGPRAFDQNSVLVNIYKDGGNYPGYVLINQTGVEMGQGVHIMVQQMAAATLNVPVGIVSIAPMSTDTVPNQICTGASTGNDVNIIAARKACTVLRDRLHMMQDKILYGEAQKRIASPKEYRLSAQDVAALQDLITNHWDPVCGFANAGDVANPAPGWTVLQMNTMLIPAVFTSQMPPNPTKELLAAMAGNHMTRRQQRRLGNVREPERAAAADTPNMYYQNPLGSYQVNYYVASFRSWKVPEPIKGQYDQWSFDYNITRQTYLDTDNYRKGVYDYILQNWSPLYGLQNVSFSSEPITILYRFITTERDQCAPGSPQYTFYNDLMTYIQLQRPKYVQSGKEPAPLTLSQATQYWVAMVGEAFNERILLTAIGQGRLNAEGDVTPSAENWFCYFIYGSAWSVVEVDGVTGQTDVIRSDIYYDAGNSPNPAADIGQVEGAFVQGLGNIMTEQCDWNRKTGVLNQPSIMDVAIPDQRMIPRSLHTHLFWLEGAAPGQPTTDTRIDIQRRMQAPVWKAPRAKAASEGSTCMSVVLMMATRNAVSELRKQLFNQATLEFAPISTPVIPQTVLEAIYGEGGALTEKMLKAQPQPTKPLRKP